MPYDDTRLKKRIDALAQLESGGLPELDYSVETPMGEARVTRQPLRPAIMNDGGRGHAPSADMPRFDRAGIRDEELEAAKQLDADARSDRLFETATRQLIGGLTRTPVQATIGEQTTNAPELLTRRRMSKMDALREVEAGNNKARTDAYLADSEAAAETREKKILLEESEAANRRERAMTQREIEAAKLEETKRNNKAREGIGWTNANRPSGGAGVAEIQERKQAMRENAIKPRGGWEPIEASAPTFRDSDQAKRFDASVAAMGAIRNHKEHVLHGLDELKRATGPAEADIALAKINAQMGALASKLRDAEGLNNTDASNHAVDAMLSLTNGSIVNLKNIANDGRLPAILDAAINSGEANLETLASSNNLRRSKQTDGGVKSGAVSMKFPDGSVHAIDPADMAEAKKRGAVPSG